MDRNNENASRLTSRQGGALVALARAAITERLPGAAPADAGQENLDNDPALRERRGTFVTLKIGGRLRGCIGSLSAVEPLVDGVRRNAVNAAFHDPRFPPLSPDELDKVSIEVSVLTEPRPLAYSDGADLVNRIRPGVDGLIIRKGGRCATFLPQVWEQLPEPEQFLAHLCIKAGLAATAWEKERLEVETYQVQYFSEPLP